MKVLKRWKHFRNDERFLSHFRDGDLIELSEAYFGFNPLRKVD